MTHLWLSVQLRRSAVFSTQDVSNSLKVELRPAPKILTLNLGILPAGSPTTDHRIRLIDQSGVDQGLHAIRIGEALTAAFLTADVDGVLSFEAPVREPGLHSITVLLREDVENKVFDSDPSRSWTSPEMLEYLELPRMDAVLPPRVRAGPLATGEKHLVTITGSNFTSSTVCEVDAVLAPTRWIASNLLECELGEGVAGQSAIIKLLERGTYHSRGTGLPVLYTTESYVYRVNPPKVIIQRVSTVVEVHVANPSNSSTSLASTGYYCRFGSRTLRALRVGQVGPPSAEETAWLQAAGQPVPETTLLITCRTPIVLSPQTFNVEAVSPDGATRSAASPFATLELVARPVVSLVAPSLAPLLATGGGITLQISGQGMLAEFDYWCNFSRPVSLEQKWEIPATRVDDTSLTCPFPATAGDIRTRRSETGPYFFEVAVVAQFATSSSGATAKSLTTSRIGVHRLLAYLPPTVSSVWPTHGSTAGGTSAYLIGSNLNMGFA